MIHTTIYDIYKLLLLRTARKISYGREFLIVYKDTIYKKKYTMHIKSIA